MFQSIQDFLYVHPWLHSALVIVPPLLLSTGVTIFYKKKESESGTQMAKLREDSNRLREKLADEVKRFADLQQERNTLQEALNSLEREKSGLLAQIAENTKQPETASQRTASRLRKYLRKLAKVTEGGNSWGAPAEIVKVEDEIVTLFVPASNFSPGAAYQTQAACMDVQVVEAPVGACEVQLRIMHRYGADIQLGDIRKWEERNNPGPAKRPRGKNVFNCSYNRPGTPDQRGLFIFSPATGNPEFTMVTMVNGQERDCFYGDAITLSRKFALQQIDYYNEGFKHSTSGKSGADGLFVFTQ